MTTRLLKNLLLATVGMLAIATPTSVRAENMNDMCRQGLEILTRFQSEGPKIPKTVLAKAKGIILMKVTKGGLILAGQNGDGVILARSKKYGWSGPVAVDSSGASLGLQGGGSVTRMAILLNTDTAVNKFINNDDIKFVGEMEGKAGPAEKDITDQWAPDSSVYVYSSTDGVYGGISFKGVTFTVDHGTTNQAYGKPVSAGEVLNGKLPPPPVAKALRDKLSSL